MLKKRILPVILLFILISNSSGNNEQFPENKNILIFFSLQPSLPAYRVILDGIRTKLTAEFGDHYTLHMEYFELDRLPEGSFAVDKIKLYNEKYREVKIDLLICVGTNLIGLLKIHSESYLLELPTVSLDFDFSKYGIPWEIKLNEKTTAIPIKVDAGKTIAAVLDLLPETTSIYFITGISSGDKIFYEVSQQEARKLKSGIKVNFISNMSMDMILKETRHLPDKSVIIIPRFTTDTKQVMYYNTESVRLISKGANAPVFTYTDMGFGDGAVGGYIVSLNKAGMITGEATVKILKGANLASIRYSEEDYYEYLFDWRELKRWNLVESNRIPKGSKILFEDVTFFGKFKWVIMSGLLFILLQTTLILRLVQLNRNQKRLTFKIIETENKYRELLRQDRIMRIGELTASLSHELRQPLTSMLSHAQAGIRFIDSNNYTPDLLKQLLQNIVEDDKRSASILSSVRGMMKLEKREKEKVDFHALVNEIVAIYHQEARDQSIDLSIHLTEGSVYVVADAIQIQQVIMNFFSNAAQSMQQSNPDERKMILTEILENGSVIFSVRDFGNGIDPAIIDSLFKPFITYKKQGFGVGLAICRTIIEDHQGKIWGENMPDGGAKFSFSLKVESND